MLGTQSVGERKRPLSLAEIPVSQHKEALKRISQFVLRRETGDIRQSIHDSVTEMAIFLGPRRGSSFEEIILAMKDKILVDFPRPVLKAILSRLMTQGRVIYDGLYRLPPTRTRDIQSQTEEHSKALQTILLRLLSKTEEYLGRELSDEDNKLIEECFFRFLASLFTERASISAKLIAGQETTQTTLSMPMQILDKSFQPIMDKKVRESASLTVVEILRNPTEALVDFLLRLDENLVCIQVLNLDPECQRLEKESFSQVNLLLDTNIIVDLMCPSSRRHYLSLQLLGLTRHLGVSIQVTRRTLKEFLDVLEDANNHFQNLKIPSRFLNAVDDEFIASYSKEKQANPHLKWEGYYLRMKRIASLLKNNWGIVTCEADRQWILDDKHFHEIAQRVSDCYEKTRLQPKRKRVAEHDAYHLILVRELRKESTTTMLGPSHWFLTYDQTLPFADPMVTEKFAYDDKTVSTMVAEIWLQMIEPFLSKDVRDKQAVLVFTELLKSQFSQIQFRIDPSKIAELQGDWLDYDWLEPKDVERILGEKFVSDYLSRLRKMRLKGEDVDKLTEQFRQELKIRIESLANEKIRSLSQRVTSLETQDRERENRERELKRQLSEKEEEFRRGWRSKSGTLGLGVVSCGVGLVIVRALFGAAQDPWTTAIVFLSGIILIFFAIAPERVTAKIEAFLGISKR